MRYVGVKPPPPVYTGPQGNRRPPNGPNAADILVRMAQDIANGDPWTQPRGPPSDDQKIHIEVLHVPVPCACSPVVSASVAGSSADVAGSYVGVANPVVSAGVAGSSADVAGSYVGVASPAVEGVVTDSHSEATTVDPGEGLD